MKRKCLSELSENGETRIQLIGDIGRSGARALFGLP
jgi:hypothetical protein